jgi:hypothetical protein
MNVVPPGSREMGAPSCSGSRRPATSRKRSAEAAASSRSSAALREQPDLARGLDVLVAVVDEQHLLAGQPDLVEDAGEEGRGGLREAEVAGVELPVEHLVVAERAAHVLGAVRGLVGGQVAPDPRRAQLADHLEHGGVDLDAAPVLEQRLEPHREPPARPDLGQHAGEVPVPAHRRLLAGEDVVDELAATARRDQGVQLVEPAGGVVLDHPVGVEQHRLHSHVGSPQAGGFSSQYRRTKPVIRSASSGRQTSRSGS